MAGVGKGRVRSVFGERRVTSESLFCVPGNSRERPRAGLGVIEWWLFKRLLYPSPKLSMAAKRCERVPRSCPVKP